MTDLPVSPVEPDLPNTLVSSLSSDSSLSPVFFFLEYSFFYLVFELEIVK